MSALHSFVSDYFVINYTEKDKDHLAHFLLEIVDKSGTADLKTIISPTADKIYTTRPNAWILKRYYSFSKNIVALEVNKKYYVYYGEHKYSFAFLPSSSSSGSACLFVYGHYGTYFFSGRFSFQNHFFTLPILKEIIERKKLTWAYYDSTYHDCETDIMTVDEMCSKIATICAPKDKTVLIMLDPLELGFLLLDIVRTLRRYNPGERVYVEERMQGIIMALQLTSLFVSNPKLARILVLVDDEKFNFRRAPSITPECERIRLERQSAMSPRSGSYSMLCDRMHVFTVFGHCNKQQCDDMLERLSPKHVYPVNYNKEKMVISVPLTPSLSRNKNDNNNTSDVNNFSSDKSEETRSKKIKLPSNPSRQPSSSSDSPSTLIRNGDSTDENQTTTENPPPAKISVKPMNALINPAAPQGPIMPNAAPQRPFLPVKAVLRPIVPEKAPQRSTITNLASRRPIMAGTAPQRLILPKVTQQRLITPGAAPLRLITPGAALQRLITPGAALQRLITPEAAPQRSITPERVQQRPIMPAKGPQKSIMPATSPQKPIVPDTAPRKPIIQDTVGTEIAATEFLDKRLVEERKTLGLTEKKTAPRVSRSPKKTVAVNSDSTKVLSPAKPFKDMSYIKEMDISKIINSPTGSDKVSTIDKEESHVTQKTTTFEPQMIDERTTMESEESNNRTEKSDPSIYISKQNLTIYQSKQSNLAVILPPYNLEQGDSSSTTEDPSPSFCMGFDEECATKAKKQLKVMTSVQRNFQRVLLKRSLQESPITTRSTQKRKSDPGPAEDLNQFKKLLTPAQAQQIIVDKPIVCLERLDSSKKK